MNCSKLNLESFVELTKQKQEQNLQQIEISSQSINRWLKYCEYHYFTLVNSTSKDDLHDDRLLQIRREGENVQLRFVYEANISAFLSSLHSLLDSFPYLLNLFIPVFDNPNNTRIKWHSEFLCKYEKYRFFNTLIDFMLDENFHKVKGYANTIKHKHLIRVANRLDYLEFESFDIKVPVRTANCDINFVLKRIENQNVLEFIEECHNHLIPKFFALCNEILDFKSCN
ncbi:hypothetical protein [Thalassotalea sp. PP2-459]|uniref:hypothetical protein n=1 Tax=Thalassotalea sp. PP2-459 TaxID=1742724 RepID=UPI000945DB75|nr:hypothetical protein [Thalassotalea sp. PP2-459]OKY27822.1 hypothetical protein BI291_07140 [Thalassotalea sp. PP2-459]